MDDIKKTHRRQNPQPGYWSSYTHSAVPGRHIARQHVNPATRPARGFRLGITIGKRRLAVSTIPIYMLVGQTRRWLPRDKRIRVSMGVGVAMIVAAEIINVLQPYINQTAYALGSADALLAPISQPMAEKLKYDQQQQAFIFNAGYSPNSLGELGATGSQATATAYQDSGKGITVTDPISNIDFTMKPKFGLAPGQQDGNRIVYPMGGQGWVVYSMHSIGAKEDVLLTQADGDTMTFDYSLGLGSTLAARLDANGVVGIYGNSLVSGNVATGSANDAKLLEKMRKNAPKDKLLFMIPAPLVRELGNQASSAVASYSLYGDALRVTVTGLSHAHFPLTVDPSIYVETAEKFMRGNNETNIDFDVADTLIQKGKTTGARFDSWTSTLALPAARWGHATAVAGGYIYVTGGNDGSSNQTTVYWSKFDTSTNALTSPNPGAGACTNWCTNSAYNLPNPRTGHSMVAYNGFLYVIGGTDSSCAGALNACNTVYIAKLGANGEPALWHPTGGTPAYWYSSANTLSTERRYAAAAAYNNRLYLAGGQTNATSNGVTTMEYANLVPTGDIGSWTSTGMVALPSARHDHSLQIYNDRMYLIGGISGALSTANLKNTVEYIKILSDGTMSGSWQTTTAFTTGRMAWGGNFSTIWGGYLYVTGGCTAITTNGCSTIAGDIQLASINADGTLTNWGSISGVTSARIGFGFVGWRNTLYGIGGCTVQNTTTAACTTTATLTEYGVIKTGGEVSTVSNSVPNGTSPCVTTAWINCDMPPLGSGNGQSGQLAGGSIINNGFIYYVGGCTAVGNNSVCFTGNASKASGNTSYSAINADGTLTRAATCPAGTFVGSWCVDSTNTINGGTGLAAFGFTIFNNVIYAVGGTSGTAWNSNVYRNPLNSDGSLGTWSSQTFAALGLGNAKGYMYDFTRANPASAGTYPGNLYVVGGCSSGTNGLDCTTFYTDVYKCFIKTDGSIETTGSACTETGQQQIDSEPGTAGSQGLGVMAGTVYANYIYMIGGQSPNETQRGEVMYAKIDNSNNIVAVSGGIWQTSGNSISPTRVRGVAFGYNGFLYALAGYNVSGGASLNDLLFAQINVSDGSIGVFTTSQVTVNPRWDLRAIVNNGYVYTFGGCSAGTPPSSCTTTTATIQTFQLYNNYSGDAALWGAGANLFGNGSASTSNRIGASAAVYNGFMYIAGGCISATDCTDATNDVQYAAIDAYGGIGAWSTGNVLPADRTWGKLLVAGGTLYYVGGQNDAATAQSTVYYTTSFSSGNPTWSGSAATKGIGDTGSGAQARTQFGAAVWNNRIYVVAGLDGAAAVSSTVYISPDLTAGGNITTNWTSSSNTLNVSRSGNAVVTYANNLYSFGGHDGTNYLNDAQYTSIGYKTGTISQSGTTVTGSGTTFTSSQVGSTIQYSDGSIATITAFGSSTSLTVGSSKTVSAGSTYIIQDGSIGSWSYTTSMPGRLRQVEGFAANGFMYLLGGRSADTTCDSNTIVAPISANTTIASGNNPTGIGEWFETNGKYSGNRYGAAAVYNDGKAYLLGGGCGATVTYTGANRIVQTTLQSQPQVAKYSIMFDTDTDVFPTMWLLNGLDNSVGAEWQLKYRSMKNTTSSCLGSAMTTWGQETSFGNVTLGTPGVYTALDGSGVNTTCARFFYLAVTIDSSQAFGYPEDVSRGPTIGDLTFAYTADPSKRLMHGRTFVGGLQQPDDTPCHQTAYAACPLP